MISKNNNNSYHDSTSAFFNVFFEKDPHLNAVESASLKNMSEQTSVKFKIKQNRTRCDIVIMNIVMITMHWYANLKRLCFEKFWSQTK